MNAISALMLLASAIIDPSLAGGFLEKELPLRVLSVIPRGGVLSAEDSLQIQFSRPVIALGDDFAVDESSAVHRKNFFFEDCHTRERLEIPGNFRWVSTSSLRFDPSSGSYPSDLCFKLRLPPTLATYDGVALTWKEDGEITEKAFNEFDFTTSTQSFWIRNVESAAAMAATDGMWQGYGNHEYLECPPDAIVTIQFRAPVDSKMVASALKIEPQTNNHPQVAPAPKLVDIKACKNTDPQNTKCITLRPKGLVRSTPQELITYKIVLPVNSKYHRYAGVIQQPGHGLVTGLLPFVFPFKSGYGSNLRNVQHKRHLFHLPHGLEYTTHSMPESGIKNPLGLDSVLSNLKSLITYSPKVEFEVQLLSNSTIELVGNFASNQDYRLEIKGSSKVRDGFGLPLESHETKFHMDSFPAFLDDVSHPLTVLPSNQAVDLGNNQVGFVSKSVSSPSDTLQLQHSTIRNIAGVDFCAHFTIDSSEKVFKRILRRHHHNRIRESDAAIYHEVRPDLLATSHTVKLNFKHDTTDPVIQESCKLPLSESKSIIMAHERTVSADAGNLLNARTATRYSMHLVTFADFSVAAVAGYQDFDEKSRLGVLLWITDLHGDFKPEVDEKIKVVVYAIYGGMEMDTVKVNTLTVPGSSVSDGKLFVPTAINGIPRMVYSIVQFGERGVAIATSSGHELYVQNYMRESFREEDAENLRVTTTTDRGMYKRGDIVHLKVIARMKSGMEFVKIKEPVLLGVSSDTGAPLASFTVDPVYGTALTSFTIPTDMRHGTQAFHIRQSTRHNGVISSFDLVIADPRIPVATLSLDINQTRFDPLTDFSPEFKVEVKTYTGSPIANAGVKVTWNINHDLSSSSLGRHPRNSQQVIDEEASDTDSCTFRSGELIATTEKLGIHRFTIDFSDVTTSHDGDSDATVEHPVPSTSSGSTELHKLCPLTPGSSLSVTATWNGPTGELLTDAKTLKVEYRRGLKINAPLRPIPGFPVRVSIDVSEDQDVLSSSSPLCCPGVVDSNTQVGVDCAACRENLTPIAFCEQLKSKHRTELHHACDGLSHVQVKVFKVPGNSTTRFPYGSVVDRVLGQIIGYDAFMQRFGFTPAVDPTNGPIECDIVLHSFSRTSSTQILDRECIIRLPSVGQFVIVASTFGYNGEPLRSLFFTGGTPQYWKRTPIKSLEASGNRIASYLQLVPKSETAAALENSDFGSASINLLTPFENSSVLLLWGIEGKSFSKIVKLEGWGQHTLTWPVSSDFKNWKSLNVQVVLKSHKSVSSLEQFTSNLTTAPWFSWGTISYLSMEESIRVDIVPQDQNHKLPGGVENLQLEIEVDKAVAKPSSQVQISVKVPDSKNAQVTVFVVDQAQLDLHRPQDLCTGCFHFMFPHGRHFEVTHSGVGVLNNDAFTKEYQHFLKLFAIDPWICPEFGMDYPILEENCSGRGTTPFGVTESQFKSRVRYPFTKYTNTWSHYGGGSDEGGDGAEMADDLNMDFAEAPELEMSLSNIMPAMAKAAKPMMMMAQAQSGDVRHYRTAARDAPAFAESMGDGIDSSPTVTAIRTSFNPVPLVATSVQDSSGVARFTLNLPDDVGKFQIRAIAVEGDVTVARFGTKTTNIVSRLPLSLVAAVPRQTRTGDTFFAGVSVSITDLSLFEGKQYTLQAEAINKNGELVELKESTTRMESVTGTGPHRLLFHCSASQDVVGNANVQVIVRALDELSGDELASDAMELTIQVMPAEHEVTLSTTVPLTLTSYASIWPEGITMPPLLRGYGYLEVIAGFGYAATQVAIARDMLEVANMDKRRETWWANCVNSFVGVFPVNVLRKYKISETQPILEEAKILNANAKNHQTCINTPSERNRIPCEYEISMVLFLQSLGSKFLDLAPDVFTDDEVRSTLDYTMYRSMLDTFRACVSNYRGIFGSSEYCRVSMYTASQVRLAKGSSWDSSNFGQLAPFLDFPSLLRAALVGSEESNYLLRCEYNCQANVALLLAIEGIESTTLTTLLNRLKQHIRVQGRTAYVAAPRSKHSGGLEVNAKVLMAMAIHEEKSTLKLPALSQVATWVSEEVSGSGLFKSRYSSTFSVLGSMALAVYDQSRGTLAGAGRLAVRSGATLLLQGRWLGPQDPVVEVKSNWTDVLKIEGIKSSNGLDSVYRTQPLPLLFRSQGAGGEIIATTRLNFIPKFTAISSGIFRGFVVDKVIRRYNSETKTSYGPPVFVLEPGEMVQVTIQVTSPDDIAAIKIIDLLPGGLEAIDEQLSGMQQKDTPPRRPNFAPRHGFAGRGIARNIPTFRRHSSFGRRWSVFGPKQTHKDKVMWESNYFRAGAATVQFLARAVTPGMFRFPGAIAFATNSPDVMGMSGSPFTHILVFDHNAPNGLALKYAVAHDQEPLTSKMKEVLALSVSPNTKGTRTCDQGCQDVNAFCMLKTQICACADGTVISNARKECPALTSKYVVPRKADSEDGYISLQFQMSFEIPEKYLKSVWNQSKLGSSLDIETEWGWALKESVAAMFPRHTMYDVAPHDVEIAIVRTQGDTETTVTFRSTVVLWAATLVGYNSNNVEQLGAAFVTKANLESNMLKLSNARDDWHLAGWKVTHFDYVGVAFAGGTNQRQSTIGESCGGASNVQCEAGLICSSSRTEDGWEYSCKMATTGTDLVTDVGLPQNYRLILAGATGLVLIFIIHAFRRKRQTKRLLNAAVAAAEKPLVPQRPQKVSASQDRAAAAVRRQSPVRS